MELINGKTLEEWKAYCKNDKVPIKTMKYIYALEQNNQTSKTTPKGESKFKEEFNNYTSSQQWGWALKNRDDIELFLDNDNTSFRFREDSDIDGLTIFKFKNDLGNKMGLCHLLNNLKFKIS